MKNSTEELRSLLKSGDIEQLQQYISQYDQLSSAQFVLLLTENHGIFQNHAQLLQCIARYPCNQSLLKLIFSTQNSANQALRHQLPTGLAQFPELDGTTLLHIAAANELPANSAVLNIIVKQQPLLLFTQNQSGYTPIDYAIMNGLTVNFTTLLRLYDQPLTALFPTVMTCSNAQIIRTLIDDPRMLINAEGTLAEDFYQLFQEEVASNFLDLQFEARYHLTKAYIALKQGQSIDVIIGHLQQADRVDHQMVITDLQLLTQPRNILNFSFQQLQTLTQLLQQLNPPPQQPQEESKGKKQSSAMKSSWTTGETPSKQAKKVSFFGDTQAKGEPENPAPPSTDINYERFGHYCVSSLYHEIKQYLQLYDNPLTADNNFWVRFAFTLPMLVQSSELITLELTDETRQVLYTCYGQQNINDFIMLFKRLLDISSEEARMVEISEFMKTHKG